MHIVHVSSGLARGGAEGMLVRLVAAQQEQGHRCSVVSLLDLGAHGRSLRANGVSVHCLHWRRGLPGPMALLRLQRLARSLHPDLVHGWMYHGNLAAAWLAWAGPRRTPLVWSIRQTLQDPAREPARTRAVLRANAWLSHRVPVITYNAASSARQHAAYGFRADNAEVVANGIDGSTIGADPAAGAALRQRLGIPASARVLLHLARRHPMKDHDSLLTAVAELLPRRPDLHVLLVGRDVPAWLDAQPAERLPAGSADRVHAAGEQVDVQPWYSAADLCCMSSAWGEAFPNVLAEALACGLDCVATDVGAARQVLGDHGHLVPPGDPRQLAAALDTALAALPTSPEVAAARRRQVLDAFGIHRARDSFAACYRRAGAG